MTNIPEGARLVVDEVDQSEYDNYLNQVAEALQTTADAFTYAKLLDISIVYEDQEIQPNGKVGVEIQLKDSEDISNPQVVHFGQETEVLDVAKTENGVAFATTGFSVYAVIGGVDSTSRITVNFFGKDTSTPLATMYVKNEDDMEQVEKILFDPGVGRLDEGEIFRGWVIGEITHKDEDTKMPTYTVEMASTEGELKTIKDIRTWAADFDAESDNYIIEGDVVNIRAAIYKNYVVTYLDDKNIAQSADSVLIMPDDTSTYYEYTISQSYTPVKDTVKFNGWVPTDLTKSHITGDTQQEDNLYQKDNVIHITGNVDFKVNQSEGHWIVFHENGKGSTYNAPQFVERGNNTVDPGSMTRKGYDFGGWYTEVTGVPDKHGYQQVVETSKFTFGGKLDDFGDGKLHLYAKWTPVETAPYTIIFWGEKIGSDGKREEGKYEVLESFVNNNGAVGQNIPYISQENGVEDYAYQTGQGAFGERLDVLPNGQNADEKGIMGHYRGFNLTEASKNQQVEITPEGDAVLNLYYDRVQYNFRFYLYRSGSGNGRYDYANNSGLGSDMRATNNGLVTWHTDQNQHPSLLNYTINGEPVTIQSENVEGRTYSYFVMPAYYGETISDIWPTYDKISGANNRVPVSYVMMVGTHLKPRATSSGTGTVKGVISVMNWNILGTTNDADGNYVVVRFPETHNNWRYHIWYEAIDEDHVPAGKKTYEYEGKLYYEETVMAVRSSNTNEGAQNEPKYDGFEYQLRVGQDRQGVWQSSNRISTTDENGHKCGTYWTTTENNTTLYHLNYIYDRQQFKITYFDGNYVDGNGNANQNKSSVILHESSLIPQGAEIADEYKNYKPAAQESGYIFEGWYLDAGCTVEYPWGTMPVGPTNGSSAINVFAKWQQIQYRVYLVSNVPADEEFTWGSDSQGTCFRVTYGEKISLPTGRDRKGWEFLGWYTTPNFDPSSRFTEDYALTDDNVTLPYDQDAEYTDTYDKWGNLNDPKKNTDKEKNRDWITKKLVLYAKWYQTLEGAEGINVVYDPILKDEGVESPTGHDAPTDSTFYIDTAEATAQAGSIADEPSKYQFECWVVQKWNGTAFEDTDVEVYPGDTFEVLKANAREEDYTDPANPQITKRYTIQLRAKYKPLEDHTPTHIDWYKNYEEGGKHEAFHSDPALQINETVSIQEAPTREGYTFLGWARVTTNKSHSYMPDGGTMPVADVLNLDSKDVYIKWEDDVFKCQNDDGDWVKVTEVAADEKTPYHDMYAVWKKNPGLVVKKTDNKDTPLNNAYFKLTLSDGKEVRPSAGFVEEDETPVKDSSGGYKMASGSIGMTYSNLVDGIYAVTETTPPDGYIMTDASTTVYLNEGVFYKDKEHTKTFDDKDYDDDGNLIVKVTNTPGQELPNTGGHGTLPYTLGGFILMISALMYGFMMRRRERRLI